MNPKCPAFARYIACMCKVGIGRNLSECMPFHWGRYPKNRGVVTPLSLNLESPTNIRV